MWASAPWPFPRAAHCGCASAYRRSDQSCSCITSTQLRRRLPHYWALPYTLRWRNRRSLPAGLDHAGNFSAHRDLAQLVAPQAELAVDAARATGQPASVAKPRRTRVARQLLQLVPRSQAVLVGEPHVGDRRLKLGALFGILFHHHAAFQISVDDSLFRHGVLGYQLVL